MRDASGCTTKAVSGKSVSHLGTRVQVYKAQATVCVCVMGVAVFVVQQKLLYYLSAVNDMSIHKKHFFLLALLQLESAAWFFHLGKSLFKTLKAAGTIHSISSQGLFDEGWISVTTSLV